MRKILAAIAFVVVVISFIVALRQPVVLFVLLGVVVIPIHYSNKIGKEISLSLVILGCVVSMFYFNSMVPMWGERYDYYKDSEERSDELRNQRYQQLNNISAAKDNVKNSLKDPSSASFKGEFVSKENYVCGKVNAKNSFGAFAGYKKFINKGGLLLIDDESPEFSKLWSESCNQ